MSNAINFFEDRRENEEQMLEIFSSHEDNGVINPEADFVISRKYDGSTLSVYDDDIWDLTPYLISSGKSGGTLYFNNIIDPDLRKEAKRLMFMLLLLKNGRGSTVLSPSRAYAYLQYLFVPMTKYAENENIALKTVFEDETHLKRFVKRLTKDSPARAAFISGIMSFLFDVGSSVSGIEYRHNSKLYKQLQELLKTVLLNIRQTPVIPPDIYKIGAKMRWAHFERAESEIDKLKAFMVSCMSKKNYASAVSRRPAKGGPVVYWEEAVDAHGLYELFEEYSIRNKKNLREYLNMLQGTCRNLIMSYTGMRNEESLMLMSDCLSTKKDGRITYVLGITKKSSGVPMEMKWVTASEIKKVLVMLKSIGETIVSARMPKLQNVPLFVKPEIFLQKEISATEDWKDAAVSNNKAELPIEHPGLKIKEEHIRMLEDISPGKDWREDKAFKLGEAWPFRAHQYRRSLAVYALNSGIVSLAALKTQFGHLFREMSAYYGNGAGSAKSLIGTDSPQHIKSEMGNLKPELDFLSYAKNVLFASEPLYGSHGTYVDKNKSDYTSYVLENRSSTIKKAKKGLFKYTETAVGGCVSLDPCDSHLMGSIVECFGCAGAELKKSKILKAADTVRANLESLQEGSVEYRTERHELDILEQQIKIIERKEDEQ